MEIRAIAPNEWKYTYSQSMQLEGQTGNIGHLRGDFGTDGYGFYTTWFDTKEQWKTDEFKTELDDVINALRSPEYGLLQSRSDMGRFARQHTDSAFKGNYCTEYGFRVDTEKHAYLLRCNLTKGDYNFYCYCYVKEWLDKHIGNAEKGIESKPTESNASEKKEDVWAEIRGMRNADTIISDLESGGIASLREFRSFFWNFKHDDDHTDELSELKTKIKAIDKLIKMMKQRSEHSNTYKQYKECLAFRQKSFRKKNADAITGRDFMRRMELSANTFYRRVREYEIRNGITEPTSA